PSDLAQPPRNSAGLALSRALPPRASGPHRKRVGRIREQAEGALLQPDRRRTETAAAGSSGLASDDRHHRRHPGYATGGSMTRDDVERRMDHELQFHIESYVDDLVRAGVERHEAERRARVEF